MTLSVRGILLGTFAHGVASHEQGIDFSGRYICEEL